jgi:hypothetical protein
MASFPELERHVVRRCRVESHGMGWLGLLWPLPGVDAVRVRFEQLSIAGEAYVGAITGGCPAGRISFGDLLAWNAQLPPGCTVVLHDGCLWLRYLVPVERLTTASVERLVTLVAREGARLLVRPGPMSQEARALLFSCFAS